MHGCRRYPNEAGELNAHKFSPGDYGYDSFVQLWYGMTPNGHLANLGAHTVTVHTDNTITVTPSIGVTICREDGFAYHGYLEHGTWRDA